MQIYRKFIRNDWCGEKCHFNPTCTPAPADTFRCGGYKVFKSMGVLFHACPGPWFCWEQGWSCSGASAGGRAALPCPCPVIHSAPRNLCSLTRGASLSFHALHYLRAWWNSISCCCLAWDWVSFISVSVICHFLVSKCSLLFLLLLQSPVTAFYILDYVVHFFVLNCPTSSGYLNKALCSPTHLFQKNPSWLLTFLHKGFVNFIVWNF